MIILLIMLVLFGLLFLGVPVAFAFGLFTLFLMTKLKFSWDLLGSVPFYSLDSFPLMAIPFFIFAGDLMREGKISGHIIAFINSIIGRIRGSLGAVTVLACMVFGTISGSSVATVSAIGSIMIPEMTKTGYNKRYATALVAAAGFLGTLIPPSIPGVVYAISSGVSIAAIFVATVVPGIILASFYILVNYLIFGRKQPKQAGPFSVKALFQNVASSGKDASWALFMPVIILGGIYGGIFTPTEAAAVSVIYGLFVGWFIYHGLNRKNILGIFRDSALTSCVLLIVLALAGSLLGRVFTVAKAPDYIAELMMQMTKSPVVFLLLFNIFVLILGCFLETNTMVIILTPIFVPIAQKYGIHPIHFGAILLLNVEIGLITPPFAGNLFVACRVSNLQLDEIVRPLLPFLFVCFPTLAITTYIPWVSMWLPRLLGVG